MLRNNVLRFALICASFFWFVQPVYADVFIGAHPDDIELFMNRNASVSIYSGVPTVLVVTTAGDAGNGAGGLNLHGIPYYRARLNAHEYAARYWASLAGGPIPQSTHTVETFGSFSIEVVKINLITIYNINLPDGGDGGGYAATGYSSLTRLLSQQISSITSVDGRNTYTLSDLKQVMRQIISRNNSGNQNVWAHFQDNDISYNPGSHPDHRATSELIQGALNEDSAFACVNRALYRDYYNSASDENLTGSERDIHIATWGAVNVGLTNSGNPNTWDPTHNQWLARQNFRTIAGGSCSF